MKTKALFALAGAVVLLSACIPSVNPFYTARDVIYDPALNGAWADPDDPNNRWQFEGNGTNAYTLTVSETQNKSAKFTAVMFRLKGHTFLDTIPDKVELKDDQPAMVGMSLIRGHLLLRVREIAPKLRLDFCDWDWLKDYLEKNPRALAHRRGGDGDDPPVLTAETRELQKFVLKHLKDGELFKVEGPDEGLVRWTNAPDTSPAPAK